MTDEERKQRLMEFAASELQPTATAMRYLATLLVTAFLTLAVCPQFGIGPLGGGHGLAHWPMSYGEVACAAFCAVFMLGTGTLVAALTLNQGQWLWVSRHGLDLSLKAMVIAMAALMLVKHSTDSVALHETWPFYLTWVITGPVTCWLLLRTIKVFKTL